MSSLRVRSMVIGVALVAALTLALPVSTEAAGLAPAARGGDGWMETAWAWFSLVWNGEVREAAAAPADMMRLSSTDPGGQASTAATSGQPCGGDQGVCIDPNG